MEATVDTPSRVAMNLKKDIALRVPNSLFHASCAAGDSNVNKGTDISPHLMAGKNETIGLASGQLVACSLFWWK